MILRVVGEWVVIKIGFNEYSCTAMSCDVWMVGFDQAITRNRYVRILSEMGFGDQSDIDAFIEQNTLQLIDVIFQTICIK